MPLVILLHVGNGLLSGNAVLTTAVLGATVSAPVKPTMPCLLQKLFNAVLKLLLLLAGHGWPLWVVGTVKGALTVAVVLAFLALLAVAFFAFCIIITCGYWLMR